VHVPSADSSTVVASIALPDAYPSHRPPDVTVHAPHLDRELQKWVAVELTDAFQPGALHKAAPRCRRSALDLAGL
jgi:hypothetical protein